MDYTTIIPTLIVCAIYYFVFTSQKTYPYSKDEYTVFKLNKWHKYFALFAMLLAIFLLIIALTGFNHTLEDILLFYISLFSFFFFLYYYLLTTNYKVIYKNGILVKYTTLRKKYKFYTKDVVFAKETPKSEIKIVFKNGKNIRIFYHMDNYENIKIILHENNIKLKVKKNLFF